MEKSLPNPTAVTPPRQAQTRLFAKRRAATLWLLVPLGLTAYLVSSYAPSPSSSSASFLALPEWQWPWDGSHTHPDQSLAGKCVQPDPLFPKPDTDLDQLFEHLSTDTFRNASVARLAGAVQIKTESFDDLGAIGADPRWDVMYDFYAYLRTAFPLVHAKLQVEKVNTHGLLYTWAGSDASLKPTLLMAHQDTVPVPPETIPAWTYPPWSGAYDGKYVWGRGAADCKNQLIAALETAELLLEAGFAPRRTVLLSFGFDEESSGTQGAGSLAPFLHARYGDDGLAVIVDEGAAFEEVWGALLAKPGMGEKGYTDVTITVRMPGGHSSIPSDHTSIGVLSELISRIEAEQYCVRLDEENPYYGQLQCGAVHAPDFPPKLRKLLTKRDASTSISTSSPGCHCHAHPDRLALEAAREGGPQIRYLMQTSQAVDVISGGVKVNALPERVQATVNHRINVGETPQMVWDHLTSLAGHVARRHNLTVHAFNGEEETPSSITLAAVNTTLAVAPVTPSDGQPFAVLAGTLRALYGRDLVVVPGIMTGNTDTRFYWDLTRHIFRFGPGYDVGENWMDVLHTVNERISVTSHVNTVKWFVLFVRNMDEADLDE